MTKRNKASTHGLQSETTMPDTVTNERPFIPDAKVVIFAQKPLGFSRRVGLLADFFSKQGCRVDVHCLEADPRLSDRANIRFLVHSEIGITERLVSKALRIRKPGFFKSQETGLKRVLLTIFNAILFPLLIVIAGACGIIQIIAPQLASKLQRRLTETYRRFRLKIRVKVFNRACEKAVQHTANTYSLILCHDIYPAPIAKKLSLVGDSPLWFDVVDHFSRRSYMNDLSEFMPPPIVTAAQDLCALCDLIVLNGHYMPNIPEHVKRENILNANPAYVNAAADKTKKTLALGQPPVTFIMAGTHFESTGLHRAIEFIEAYDHTAILKIIGFFPRPSYKQQLQDIIVERKLEKRVFFQDRKTHDELITALCQADAVLMPFDAAHENLKRIIPNRLFDALSARTPVIVQSGTATADWATQHEFGAAVDFADIQGARRLCRAYLMRDQKARETQMRYLRENWVWDNQVQNLRRHLLRLGLTR